MESHYVWPSASGFLATVFSRFIRAVAWASAALLSTAEEQYATTWTHRTVFIDLSVHERGCESHLKQG